MSLSVMSSRADFTFASSVTSALASIAFSFVWSASVNTFESVAASTADLISAFVWSAVAAASMPSSFVLSPFANAPSLGGCCAESAFAP